MEKDDNQKQTLQVGLSVYLFLKYGSGRKKGREDECDLGLGNI
jgi:hypothetical protein